MLTMTMCIANTDSLVNSLRIASSSRLKPEDQGLPEVCMVDNHLRALLHSLGSYRCRQRSGLQVPCRGMLNSIFVCCEALLTATA